MITHPDAPLTRFLKQAIQLNLPFITHHVDMAGNYHSASHVVSTVNQEFTTKVQDILSTHRTLDPNGKLGTYARINPQIDTPTMYSASQPLFEPDRMLLTRFRTGSHNLQIETGRWTRVPRDQRFCTCGHHIQSLDHVIHSCTLLAHHRVNTFTDLNAFFAHQEAVIFLHELTSTLKL